MYGICDFFPSRDLFLRTDARDEWISSSLWGDDGGFGDDKGSWNRGRCCLGPRDVVGVAATAGEGGENYTVAKVQVPDLDGRDCHSRQWWLEDGMEWMGTFHNEDLIAEAGICFT
jgi:hypothetical protein